MKLATALLFTVIGATNLIASEELVKHRLRILPLGDPPPYRQQIRDGVRYEIPAAEGTIPPRNIVISAADAPADTAETEAPLPVRLRLGSPSSPQSFTLPEKRLVQAKADSGAPWLTIPLTTSEATLAVVCRGGESWKSARVLAIPDDAKPGDFRFINLTAKPMAVTWGSEKLKLDAGKTMVRRLADGAPPVPVTIQYPSPEGGLRLCLSTQAEAAPGTSQQFLIYAADGERPTAPVKVLALSEQA